MLFDPYDIGNCTKMFLIMISTKIFKFTSLRYVPAAVEISRTASSSGNSNLMNNDHRNHTSRHTGDGMHQGHSFGMSANNGGHSVNSNLAFHDLVEPGLNGKSNSQRSHIGHHQHSSYVT